MDWNKGSFIVDCCILGLLVVWMTLDRFNIYFRK